MDRYIQQYYIEEYMCDRNKNLLPSHALKLIQSISTIHCYDAGVVAELVARNQTFLLSRQQVKFTRPIKAYETVTLTSTPTTARMGVFPRITTICDSCGCEVAYVDARWFLLDIANNKPVRTMDESIPYHCVDVGRLAPITFPRLDNLDTIDSVKVRYTQIDCHGHINNTLYLDYISDILCDKFLYDFAVNYRKEVTTDYITLKGQEIENGYYLAGYCGEELNFEIVAHTTLQ